MMQFAAPGVAPKHKYAVDSLCTLQKRVSAPHAPMSAPAFVATEQTLAAVASERAYQSRIAAKFNHAGQPTLEADILMLRVLLGQIETAWYAPKNVVEVTELVRKLAAVAVRSLDNHGAPLRETPPSF